MKFLPILAYLFLCSCASLPQFFQAVEDIETDTALSVELSKDAMQKEKDVHVTITVQNNQTK